MCHAGIGQCVAGLTDSQERHRLDSVHQRLDNVPDIFKGLVRCTGESLGLAARPFEDILRDARNSNRPFEQFIGLVDLLRGHLFGRRGALLDDLIQLLQRLVWGVNQGLRGYLAARPPCRRTACAFP